MKLVSAIVAAGILAGFGFRSRAELVDGIRVIVNDSIITDQQVLQYTAPLFDRLRAQYGDQPALLRKKIAAAEADNQERLVERDLILHDFETSGYTNALPDRVIDDELRAYIRSNYGDDRIRFIKTLQAEGKTLEEFRHEFRNRIIVQQMRYLHESHEGMVSPHKIEDYYQAHKDQFKQESEVKLRMIVLTKPSGDTNQTAKLAAEILAKVQAGASFSNLATIYSQGSQRSEGGDWGWVGKSVLRKELAQVAFSLKKGQTSGVINTPQACYLMLVEDKHPEHIQPLNQVRDQIEAVLMAQERDQAQKRWIRRLKKKTFVRYF